MPAAHSFGVGHVQVLAVLWLFGEESDGSVSQLLMSALWLDPRL